MTSLQEVYVSVKSLIATNLSTMGVTGYSSDDGLTTLANAILEVEGGSDLTISLDLVSSSSSIQSGQTVNLTATLSATFNGETVDLNSVLQNAPITFKEGNTTINTVSTNTNGVATISNYAPVGTGTVTLSAQFPTTDGFDGATDVITITVEDVSPVATSISLTADKSILSYADSESATLSATVLDQFDDPMSGETVEFFNGSTSMGTATTNASGVATKSYSSTGVGDVSFSAEVGSLVSESFVIQDIYLYDPLVSEIHTWSKLGTNCSYSFSSNGLYVKGTSGGTYLKLDETYPSTYSVEMEITKLESTSALKGGTFTCENTFMQSTSSNILIATMNGAEQTVNQTYGVGDTIKIEYDGTNVKYYKNGSLLGSTGKGSGTYTGFSIRNVVATGITIKNLKIKAL